MALKLKVKKTLLKRKMEGVTVPGYYGRVITNGTKTFEDILKSSTHGSTLDYREAELAAKMMIDGIADAIKQGYIVDLGVLGKLYPAVNGTWETDPDLLKLSDMKPKVNYKAGDDIAAAIKGASLVWTTEAETEETAAPTDDEQTTPADGGTGTQTGGGTQQGGGTGTINTGGNNQQGTALAAPTISGNTSFAESTQVTMTAEEGAGIRYTTDGTDPTTESTEYTEPISLSDTTTVKAIAVKDGVSSDVATKTFTKSAGGDDSE